MKTAYEVGYIKLSYSLKTAEEILEALMDRGYSEKESKDAVKRLRQEGYINDVYFAQIYINSNRDKGRSLARMQKELIKKGVSAEDIRLAVDTMSEEGFEPLESEMNRGQKAVQKLYTKNGYDAGDKIDKRFYQKVARHLDYQGFSPYIISKLLEDLRVDWSGDE